MGVAIGVARCWHPEATPAAPGMTRGHANGQRWGGHARRFGGEGGRSGKLVGGQAGRWGRGGHGCIAMRGILS